MHLVTNQNSNNMAKTPKKVKEPVRLRFKALADGNKSIYLDIYRNGKRSYEFLKLYLVPETNPLQKQVNADTLKAANAIKAQRIIELANNEAGIKNTQRGKMLLADWMRKYEKDKVNKGEATHTQIKRTAALLDGYSGSKTRLCDVDKDFCIGFIDYLLNVYTTSTGKHIEQKTAHNYCKCFSTALNQAVRDEVIAQNPFHLIAPDDKIADPKSHRTYLTKAEVKQLETTPCRKEEVKQAYLFGCFSGLRISDVERLRWKDIVTDGGEMRLSIVMKKTKDPLYITLSKTAIKHLPDRGTAAATDTIFKLPSRPCIRKVMEQWTAAAGMSKKVTFHTSRHTAATMMLTAGADIATVSKILGHTNVKTTQIYAKIINEKIDQAATQMDNYFNE